MPSPRAIPLSVGFNVSGARPGRPVSVHEAQHLLLCRSGVKRPAAWRGRIQRHLGGAEGQGRAQQDGGANSVRRSSILIPSRKPGCPAGFSKWPVKIGTVPVTFLNGRRRRCFG